MVDEYYNLTKCGLVWKLDYECYKYTKRKLASKLDDEENRLFLDNGLFLNKESFEMENASKYDKHNLSILQCSGFRWWKWHEI